MRFPAAEIKRFATIGRITGLSVAASIVFYFAAPHEGRINVAYWDAAGAVWTICEGHTSGVKQGDKATDAECDEFKKQDIAAAEAAYDRLVGVEHPPQVKAAVVDFIFNVGSGNFAGSTMRKKLNAGDRVGACEEFRRWVYAGRLPNGQKRDCRVHTKVCGGIVTRRENERALCLYGLVPA